MKIVAAALYLLVIVSLNDSAWAETASVPLPKGILPLEARPAPEMVLNDIDGNRFDLAQFRAQPLAKSSAKPSIKLSIKKRGSWVFVHFWASWCVPCRLEMPAIQRMLEKLPEPPFKVAIVNTAENEDTVFTFLGVLAPDIVSLMDTDGLATEAWQPRGLPSTYLVDPDGMIRYQALGGRPWDEDAYLQFLRSLTPPP